MSDILKLALEDGSIEANKDLENDIKARFEKIKKDSIQEDKSQDSSLLRQDLESKFKQIKNEDSNLQETKQNTNQHIEQDTNQEALKELQHLENEINEIQENRQDLESKVNSILMESNEPSLQNQENEQEQINQAQEPHIQNEIENTQQTNDNENLQEQQDIQNYINEQQDLDSIESNEEIYNENYENIESSNENYEINNEINNIKQNIESNLRKTGKIKETKELNTNKENIGAKEWVEFGFYLIATYLLATRFIRVGKIIFIIFFSMLFFEICELDGFAFNTFWLGAIWLILLLSVRYDFLAIKLNKTWSSTNFSKNLLFKNVKTFNLIFAVFFIVFLGFYVSDGYRSAWFAFFALLPLNLYYKRAEFIANTITITTKWATSVDSKSYSLVGSIDYKSHKNTLFENFEEKQIQKQKEILRKIVDETLNELDNQGLIILQKLGREQYILGKEFCSSLIEYANNIVRNSDRISAKAALEKLKAKITLDPLGVEDVFILTESVQKCIFDTDEYYVHYFHLDKYRLKTT
ncbi:hypothetical protein DCO58_05190 [Helicobacter saguini]|uniref:Uncharacterized protein n=1 Tax=Helicobacter saguini TaxID=1548018 RepID=A0A347VT35_9HELI|nr:hypothetical protein [Helicobacter saguini]MWV62255.1 hypothetical protein [Helicobacter saguini]MWV67072.1 hypothetical protein [Helicobacter saguini]MWV69422.1 hypothetical protein [Helicobacter saguini]MWV71024.1 hypothetical protein [Helicobacter saguini]TLD95070.1 hypothetical protein LS64_003950 [Helicobacter saguini]